MLMLRIGAAVAALAMAAGILLWLFTGDRRYLALAGKVAKATLALILVVLGLMFLERVIAL